MRARDRSLPEWFGMIRRRQITLPRFQRQEAWGNQEVAGLLTTVFRGLPSGATLILEVGDREQFVSRTLAGAPEDGDRVVEQLLDGQQRLTALWRSLYDDYPRRTYLVTFEPDPHRSGRKLPVVYGQARWDKNGKRYPLWVEDPSYCWNNKNSIPLALLKPDDISKGIDEWVEAAIPKDAEDRHAAYKDIKNTIDELRLKVREFNLPYLALPVDTPKDVALDVFVKMNTSSVRLTAYDIIVALVEEETGKSLQEHVDALLSQVARVKDYADPPSLVLDTTALRQDRVPSRAGYQRIDFPEMIDSWDALVDGVAGMIRFLEEEAIYDEQRLPSYTALPVVAALWQHMPTDPDKLGTARHVLRKYLWRAFLTSRYEQSSTSNALQDFRALKAVLAGEADESVVPVFDETLWPLPTKENLLAADWPKRRTILGRGVLALQMKCGAEDLADGQTATVASIVNAANPREYHHLYPDALLREAGLSDEMIFRALNCALITWRTNRKISRKDPIEYIRDRVDNSALGEEDIRRRVRTHLIPYDELAVASYDGLPKEEGVERIRKDYEAFIIARAKLIEKAARIACEGRPLDVGAVLGGDA